MRILMINAYARVTGGADRQCFGLADGLRDRGHEVRYLSTQSEDNTEHDGAFVPLLVTNSTRDDLSTLGGARVAGNALWSSQAAAATAELIREFRPHVAHAHKLYPQLSVSPVVIARRQGVPVVQTLHDYEFISASPYDAYGGWLDRANSRLRYRALQTGMFPVRRSIHRHRVSKWVAVSRFIAKVHAARGITASVVPNFADWPAGEGSDFASRRGAAFIGRLTPEKGILDLIDLARAAPDIPVTVAGSGPLRERVRHSGLPNLHYAGSLGGAGVRSLLASVRVCLMPSNWEEPGPLAALEAMAAGTPIAAYRRGGLAEYVSDAGAGLLTASTPSALAEASARLHEDAREWLDCSQGGLSATRGVHSRDHCVGLMEEIYATVAHPRDR